VKLAGDIFQHLRDIFAELLHRAAAAGTGLLLGQMRVGHARKMLGQRMARLRSRRGGFDRKSLAWRLRLNFRAVGFQLFELQFQLLDLALDLFRPAPKLHAAELGDQQLQMFDLALSRHQFNMLRQDQCLQRLRLQRVKIRQRDRRGNHVRSMP
jgi:hypothetical protein